MPQELAPWETEVAPWETEAPKASSKPVPRQSLPDIDGVAAVQSVFPGTRINDNRRDPNSPLGRANPGSFHNFGRNAVDIPAIPGLTFEQAKKQFEAKGYKIHPDSRDEYANPSAHATGGHWHFVFEGAPENGAPTAVSDEVAPWDQPAEFKPRMNTPATPEMVVADRTGEWDTMNPLPDGTVVESAEAANSKAYFENSLSMLHGKRKKMSKGEFIADIRKNAPNVTADDETLGWYYDSYSSGKANPINYYNKEADTGIRDFEFKPTDAEGPQLSAPPPLSFTEVIGKTAGEMMDPAGTGLNAAFMRSLSTVGMSPEQEQRYYDNIRAERGAQERFWNDQSNRTDSPILDEVGKFIGASAGDVNPTYLVGGGGTTVGRRIGAQALTEGATDLVTQGAENVQGLRDGIDPAQVLTNAAAGAAFQGVIGEPLQWAINKYSKSGMTPKTYDNPKVIELTETPSAPTAVPAAVPTPAGKKPTVRDKKKTIGEKVSTITKGWTNMPDTLIHTTRKSFEKAEPELAETLRREGALAAPGFYAYDGKVHIIAENVKNDGQVESLIYHEALTHDGLMKTFRDDLDTVLTSLYEGNWRLRQEAEKLAAGKYGSVYTGPDRLARLTEEVLAKRSEAGVISKGILDKIIPTIRKYGRELGLDLRYTDREVKAILADAHKMVISGTSEAVSPSGLRYVLAYHGSPNDFDKFSSERILSGTGQNIHGRGTYFTTDKGEIEKYRGESGKTYEADIPDTEYLKEALPLSEQPFVQEKLEAAGWRRDDAIWAQIREAGNAARGMKTGSPERRALNRDVLDPLLKEAEGSYSGNWLGKELYNRLANRGNPEQTLLDLGIKGNEYPSPRGGRGFVAFEPEKVDIINKYMLEEEGGSNVTDIRKARHDKMQKDNFFKTEWKEAPSLTELEALIAEEESRQIGESSPEVRDWLDAKKGPIKSSNDNIKYMLEEEDSGRAGSINLDKIVTKDGLNTHALYRAFAEGIDKESVTYEDAVAAVMDRGIQPSKKLKKQMKLDPTIGISAAIALEKGHQELMRVQKRLFTENLSLGQQQKLEARAAYLIARQAEAQAELAGWRSNVGRALNFMKIAIDKDGPVLEKLFKEIGSAPLSNREVLYKFLGELERLEGNPKAQAKMTKDAFDPLLEDYFLSFQYSMMLYGLGTQAVNFVGNAGTTMLDAASSTVASIMGLRNKMAGDARVPLRAAMFRNLAMMKALFELQTWRDVGWSFLEGRPAHQVSKVEVGHNIFTETFGPAGTAIDLPQKALAASDSFWRSLLENAHLYEQAYILADKEGLKGAKLHDRVSEIIANPPEDVKLLVDGNVATIQLVDDPSPFTQWIERIKSRPKDRNDYFRRGVRLLAQMIFPFSRVTDNIVRTGIRHTPGLGMLDRQNLADFKAGGERRDKAIARQIVGGTIIAYLVNKAMAGELSGEGPENLDERRLLEASGWQPNSIKLSDGKWHSMQGLDAIQPMAGVIAGLMGDYKEGRLGKDDWMSDVINLPVRLGTHLSQNTFAEQAGQFLQMLGTGPSAKMAQNSFIPGLTTRAIPAFVRQYAEDQDGYMRDTSGTGTMSDRVAGRLKSSFPGLRETLPMRYDVFGRPVESNRPLFGLNREKTPDPDPIVREIIRLDEVDGKKGALVGPVDRGSLPEGPVKDAGRAEDVQALQKLSGEYIYADLASVIGTEEWKALDDQGKIKLVKKIVKDQRKNAKAELFPDPEEDLELAPWEE